MIIKALLLMRVLLAAGSKDPESTVGDSYKPVDDLWGTKDSERAECVPYYKCSKQPETHVIDLHVSDSPCQSPLDVYCADSDRKKPVLETKRRQGCGWRNPEGAGGVSLPPRAGNQVAQYGEFPWMCAIKNKTTNQIDQYVGGGSLIHPSVVLTAAHVIPIPAQMRVRCGEWDSINDFEPYPYQERDVASFELHAEYHRKTLNNDVALLFLSQPMELTPHVGVACLPPPLVETGEGMRCTTLGWGKDRFGNEGRYTNFLMKVESPTISHSRCEEQLRRTRLGARFNLSSSFVCAGDNATSYDPCIGDAGAPLSCPIQNKDGRYMVLGLVLVSVGCSPPAVHVSMSAYRGWVDERCARRGYDTTVYNFDDFFKYNI